MFPIPPGKSCKIHMGIDAFLGLDWWLWKLAPRTWFRTYFAGKLARSQRYTEIPPGMLSFSLPDEPHVIVEVITEGGRIRTRPLN